MSLVETLLPWTTPGIVGIPSRAIRDQGKYDTCFSCAIAACLEARSLSVPKLSEAFLVFHSTSAIQVTIGLEATEARYTLGTYGIARRSLYDHDIKFGKPAPSNPPNSIALQDALRRRSLFNSSSDQPEFRRLSDLYRARLWQTQIRSQLPVLLRIWQNPGYLAMKEWKDGSKKAIWQDRTFFGANHVVAVIGFDPATEQFIVQDSQGTSFGNDGQWYLPFAQADAPAIMEAYEIAIPIARLI
jgi:hypothetical protein